MQAYGATWPPMISLSLLQILNTPPLPMNFCEPKFDTPTSFVGSLIDLAKFHTSLVLSDIQVKIGLLWGPQTSTFHVWKVPVFAHSQVLGRPFNCLIPHDCQAFWWALQGELSLDCHSWFSLSLSLKDIYWESTLNLLLFGTSDPNLVFYSQQRCEYIKGPAAYSQKHVH